jgi:hypothetical protein
MRSPPKKAPGELASKAARQTDYGTLYRVIHAVQRPLCALCWILQQLRDKIETKRELAGWNKGNQ